jgi:hypothetical protein
MCQSGQKMWQQASPVSGFTWILQKSKKKKGCQKPTNPHWLVVVDERTKLKFTSFHDHKGGMIETYLR